MEYDLFIATPKHKIYWNDYLKEWVDNVESSTPLGESEFTTPLPFSIQAEPVSFDSI